MAEGGAVERTMGEALERAWEGVKGSVEAPPVHAPVRVGVEVPKFLPAPVPAPAGLGMPVPAGMAVGVLEGLEVGVAVWGLVVEGV